METNADGQDGTMSRLRSDLAPDRDEDYSLLEPCGIGLYIRAIRRYYNDLEGDLVELLENMTEQEIISLRREHEAFDAAARRLLGIDHHENKKAPATPSGPTPQERR